MNAAPKWSLDWVMKLAEVIHQAELEHDRLRTERIIHCPPIQERSLAEHQVRLMEWEIAHPDPGDRDQFVARKVLESGLMLELQRETITTHLDVWAVELDAATKGLADSHPLRAIVGALLLRSHHVERGDITVYGADTTGPDGHHHLTKASREGCPDCARDPFYTPSSKQECPGCGGPVSERYRDLGVCRNCAGTTDDPRGDEHGGQQPDTGTPADGS